MLRSDIVIKETTEDDLNHIVELWNSGDVMFYVGFPQGLNVTKEKLVKQWLPHININHLRKHYSIYHQELGFCGETYYEVKTNHKAALDIKLFPKARGLGIATYSLKYAISNAFNLGQAEIVYVDPHIDNQKAVKLYKKLGFKELTHPESKYRETHLYFELSKGNLLE